MAREVDKLKEVITIMTANAPVPKQRKLTDCFCHRMSVIVVAALMQDDKDSPTQGSHTTL